jgi:outer membrane cobalamin receptor
VSRPPHETRAAGLRHCAIAALGVVLCAGAVPLPCAADGVQTLDTVDVVGHTDATLESADSASEGHIDRQTVQELPLLRPGEVMEQVPGMIVTQHSGDGKANQYFLRGFNLDHGTDFETIFEGMPVNLPSHAHGQGYTDLNFLIPELVGGIDFNKGPYRAFQGDFATAGSAEIHYVDRLDSFVQGTLGSYHYDRGLLAGSTDWLGGSLLYGLEMAHDDGPWDRAENFNKLNGVLRYTFNGDGNKLSAMFMSYTTSKWNATDQVPQRALDESLISRYGAIDPSDGGQTHRYSESLQAESALAGGKLKSTLYGVQYFLDLNSNFTFFLNDPVHGDQIKQYDKRDIFGWNGSWTRPGQLYGLPLTTTAGWDIRSDHVTPSGLYHTEDQQILSTVLQDDVAETTYAVYGESEVLWTGWLRSITGLRLLRTDMDVTSDTPANSGMRQAGMGLPKLSLVFGPWARTSFYVNAGEGYHSNDARGATQTVDTNPVDANFGAPVAAVSPLVRAKGAEVGVRTGIVPGLQTSFALWTLHLDSELVFDGDTGTTEAGRPSRRSGVEWSAAWDAARMLRVDVNVAYSRAHFTDSSPAGDDIPEALQLAASGSITLHDWGPWSAGLAVRYFGPRPLTEDGSVKSTSTTVCNTQVTYRWDRHLSSQLEVLNLLNSHDDDIAYYYTSRLPGEPAQGVNDIVRHPVEPRSLRVSLRWSF